MPSRTAVNAQSGACTPAGGLLTGEHPHKAPRMPGAVTRERGEIAVQSAPCSPMGVGWQGPGQRCPRPAGVLVLLSLDYLTAPFYYIPKAALAAVIIMAVAPLFDAQIVRTLWRVKSMWFPVCPREAPTVPQHLLSTTVAGGSWRFL